MPNSSAPTDRWSAGKSAAITLTVVAIASLVVGGSWLLQAANGNFDKFGGYFGGVLGPILSGLAFVALVYTIKLQTEQISIARDELAEAKVERQQTQEQAKIATFFEMVQLHHLIVSGIKIGTDEGRAALSYLATHDLEVDYRFSVGQEGHGLNADRRTGEQFLMHHPNAGIYFRNLYRILKFVHENDVGDKFSLTGLLRAQLSDDELLLIFYNGLSKHGVKFKPLMERYALLEHLTVSRLFTRESTGFYDMGAFGLPPLVP